MLIQPQNLGRVDYLPTYAAMQAYTEQRDGNAGDQLWLCEHNRVYTQGLAGKKEHILNAGDIPVIQTDRGGQVTYHGPGQVVAYALLDLKRAGYFVKEYVFRIEEAVIRTLLHFGVTGYRVAGAPGIYVRLDDPSSHAMLAQRPMKRVAAAPEMGSEPPRATAGSGPIDGTETPSVRHQRASPDFTGLGKIAALGIKVSRNCTYHGVALNVAMDLEPYSRINPCGYQALQAVDLFTIGVSVPWQEVAEVLTNKLVIYLGH